MPTETTLTWDTLPERKAWSSQLIDSITTAKIQLDHGNPEAFVPGYANLSSALQIKFWAELIVAIAHFESSWKPHEIFHEPPPLGVDSVGLLQLSYEDEPNFHLEKLDRGVKSLEDPLVNLRCGVKILRGGARYWSVLRPGHHLDEIRGAARNAVGLA